MFLNQKLLDMAQRIAINHDVYISQVVGLECVRANRNADYVIVSLEHDEDCVAK